MSEVCEVCEVEVEGPVICGEFLGETADGTRHYCADLVCPNCGEEGLSQAAETLVAGDES